MMSIPGRESSRTQRMSPHEIRTTISDMEMGPWISSLVSATLESAEFASDDFMGRSDDAVSILELVEATVYHAKVMGYSPSWESAPSAPSAPSATFDDFERRACVYTALCKKVDNWSTPKGGRKLASVKKTIRERVSDKAASMRARPDPLQVLGSEAKDMVSIYTDADYKRFFCSLHRLGNCPEEDPRYYIHMVYRYYMNNFHRQLADDNEVLRFPSIQKVMDVKVPVNSIGSTPSEFKMFLKYAKGNTVTAVTLPVPSKEVANEVVYKYAFEQEVPWVPVMRSRIFDVFAELGSLPPKSAAKTVYPTYLIRGENGSGKGNKQVVDALARSIEMKDLEQTLLKMKGTLSRHTKKLLGTVLSTDRRIADIFPRYINHSFVMEGEQLRERIGFLLQYSVRRVFQNIATVLPDFDNDIYTGLKIKFDTMDAFREYCTGTTPMRFDDRSDVVWRNFVIDVRKISWVLHAWSKRSSVKKFVKNHGSGDNYLRTVVAKLD